ncbi:MAG: FecR domain-containing protein [Deltaproteobacteria bacterium]|nr:FecR domain-containing protein [Deltaproteobacteria bacterium]
MADKSPLARLVGEPEWETLQERRVYARIREKVDAGEGRRAWPLRIGLAVAGVCVTIAGVLLVLHVVYQDGPAREPKVIAKQTSNVVVPPAPLPHMSLTDGSKIYLAAGAKMHVARQDSEAIHLVQQRGEVRYEVKKGLSRSFEVRVDDVRVRVVGTVFTVAATADAVQVTVRRGRVEVDRGGRTFTLGSKEQLKLPRQLRADEVTPKPAVKSPVKERRRVKKKTITRADLQTLLARVDAARRAGDLPRAAALLRDIMRNHRLGARKQALLFTLGKVEQGRKRFTVAAKIFSRCRAANPAGSLVEDALAGEALALSAGGNEARARALAQRYAARYPAGIHLRRLRSLLR